MRARWRGREEGHLRVTGNRHSDKAWGITRPSCSRIPYWFAATNEIPNDSDSFALIIDPARNAGLRGAISKSEISKLPFAIKALERGETFFLASLVTLAG
jgi:hypothetical protein